MEFVATLDTSELPEGQMKRVVIGDVPVLLANVGGKYYAIANKCNHLGGSLASGRLEGNVVTCPKHGAQFDVKTGDSLRGAKLAFLKMGVKDQESYAVRVEGTTIMVQKP